MANIKFSKAGETDWQPSRGRTRPTEPGVEDILAKTPTEAGRFRASVYGRKLTHPVRFEDLDRADFDGGYNYATNTQDPGTQSLYNWWYNAADGVVNTFTLTDEGGVTHTVRFASGTFLPRDPDGKYINIDFELEEEV